MTSLRQIEANRCNALKSTGPKTTLGKQYSRCNAMRHGLTAETVIQFLEDQEDYKAFELSVTADFDARTAVERKHNARTGPSFEGGRHLDPSRRVVVWRPHNGPTASDPS